MATQLPAGAPSTIGEAFAHINAVASPSLDDLKVMVLLEAAGLEMYRGMVPGTDNAQVAALFEHNGREELAHAHRVSKAIKAIGGEDFAPAAFCAKRMPDPFLFAGMLTGQFATASA